MNPSPVNPSAETVHLGKPMVTALCKSIKQKTQPSHAQTPEHRNWEIISIVLSHYVLGVIYYAAIDGSYDFPQHLSQSVIFLFIDYLLVCYLDSDSLSSMRSGTRLV